MRQHQVRRAGRLWCVASALALLCGCRCAGGGTGEPCRTNSDCAVGLFCDPELATCRAVPRGSDAAGIGVDGGGTDAATGATCGDGICNGGENGASCAADCPPI